MTARRWAAAGVLLLLTACAGAPRRPAVPTVRSPTVVPARPSDLESIPDAVPRYEPRSPFGNPPFYQVDGRRYTVLASAAGYVERGVASWYGTQFHGLRTATGEPYDMFAMTAAHKTLPLPCYARVTNLSNGRSVVVRINDRGPFVANRIIDLSYTAAIKLDMIRTGTAFVQVQTLTADSPFPVSIPASVPAILPDATAVTVPAQVPVPVPTALPPMAPPSSSNFYIQVGAFAQPDNARRIAQRLRQAGFAQIVTLPAGPHQPLQRVRIGPVASVQQFDVLIARLQMLGFSGARLAQD